MERKSVPYEVGLESNPKANVGIVEAKGFDGHFAWKQKIGKVDFTLRGNMTYSKNKIIERDEEILFMSINLIKGIV